MDQDVKPAFSTRDAPEKTKAWEHALTPAEEREAAPLLEKVDRLLNTGVTGVQLIYTFFKCRVSPLQQRARPMWAYEGAHDATRLSDVELSANELDTLVKSVTSYTAEATVDYAFAIDPFSLENPLSEVSSFSLILLHSLLLSCRFLLSASLLNFYIFVSCRGTRPSLHFLPFLKPGLSRSQLC